MAASVQVAEHAGAVGSFLHGISSTLEFVDKHPRIILAFAIVVVVIAVYLFISSRNEDSAGNAFTNKFTSFMKKKDKKQGKSKKSNKIDLSDDESDGESVDDLKKKIENKNIAQ